MRYGTSWALLAIAAGGFAFPEDGSPYFPACTKPKYLESTRRIPRLPLDARRLRPKLLQVQVVLRHGARTPYDVHRCWSGPEVEWNCMVHEHGGATLTAEGPDSQRRLQSHEFEDPAMPSSPFVFEFAKAHESRNQSQMPPFVSNFTTSIDFVKMFDAWPWSQVLHGNCEKGQLLEEGIVQQTFNGRVLAEAFLVPDSGHFALSDDAHPLFDLEALRGEAGRVLERHGLLYLRASDYQRTRLSGMTLVTSMLRTASRKHDLDFRKWQIPVHTADQDTDFISPNEEECYDLTIIREAGLRSAEWKQLLNRNEKVMSNFKTAAGITELESPDDTLDCIVSAVCADRWDSIPKAMRPTAGRPPPAVLLEALKAVNNEIVFRFTWNDAAYSKKAISRQMVEVKAHIYLILQQRMPSVLTELFDTIEELDEWRRFAEDFRRVLQPTKFVVWSAHDTTVLPFLSGISVGLVNSTMREGYRFPTYASMATVELYEVEGSGKFRLTYNGGVYTDKVPGCEDEAKTTTLCSVVKFFRATTWASPAAGRRPCLVRSPQAVSDDREKTEGRRSGTTCTAALLAVTMGTGVAFI